MRHTTKKFSKKVPLALLAAASLLVLSGCVSESPETAADLKPGSPQATDKDASVAANAAAASAQPGYVDPAVVSAASASRQLPSSGHTQVLPPQQPQGAYGQSPQIGGLATQPTGISAGSQSIFSNGSAAVVAPLPASAGQQATTDAPAYAPARRISPALNSVYSSPSAPLQPTNSISGQEHSSASQPSADMGAGGTSIAKAYVTPDRKNVPVPNFFATVGQRGGNDGARSIQVAALQHPVHAGMALPGKAMMTDEFDETDGNGDSPTGLMKLASLSGLSRIAPNGLVLQTDQVNVGCLKPELVQRIKGVEAHYQRPAIITSGYRPPKSTTQHSKHYTCEAVDIQVKGVSKWELAEYLRSLPDRGGVGTYCHTESVHLDLGEPRDWNWRCKRTAQPL